MLGEEELSRGLEMEDEENECPVLQDYSTKKMTQMSSKLCLESCLNLFASLIGFFGGHFLPSF